MASVDGYKLVSGFEFYFCVPHSLWQRPTNESTNELVHEFFPKDTDFTKATDEEVVEAQWLLNNLLKQALNWKLPSDAMMGVLEEDAMFV